jgi:hypothetical protein
MLHDQDPNYRISFAVFTLLTVANSAPDAVHVVVLSIACAVCKKSGQLTLSPTPQCGIDVSTIYGQHGQLSHRPRWHLDL